MTSLLDDARTAAASMRRELAGWQEPAAFLAIAGAFPLAGLLDEELARLPLEVLPGMAGLARLGGSTAGSAPALILGRCGSFQLLVCQGAPPLHAGLGARVCVLPVCAAVCAGIANINVLGVASGIRDGFKPGMLMVLTDYINGFGVSPLAGNHGLADDLTVDMRRAFSQQLNSEFVNAAAQVSIEPRLGSFQAYPGPELPSPLEVQAALRNGVDAMGTGLLLEIIAACAMGAKTMGLAVITDFAANSTGPLRTLADRADTCSFIAPLLIRALRLYFSGCASPELWRNRPAAGI